LLKCPLYIAAVTALTPRVLWAALTNIALLF
jgi:hypothetical protein